MKKKQKSILKIAQCFIALCLFLFMNPVSYAVAEEASLPSNPEAEVSAEKQVGSKEKEEKKEEKKYGYNPAGKTDPFESFLTKSGAGNGTRVSARDLESAEAVISNKEPETELEKIEISKLTLTSIIKGEEKVWAMVIDPKGRGYFLEKGTKIGMQSGFVDEIVCEYKDTAFGPEIVRKVIVKVPYRDRNRNIIHRTIEMEMPYKTL